MNKKGELIELNGEYKLIRPGHDESIFDILGLPPIMNPSSITEDGYLTGRKPIPIQYENAKGQYIGTFKKKRRFIMAGGRIVEEIT